MPMYLPIENALIYVDTKGDGAPPLIFLHAGVGDSRLWDAQFAAFADADEPRFEIAFGRRARDHIDFKNAASRVY